jgi:hypothetical protein
MVEYKPKLDLSQYDMLTAKDKLFEFVCRTAKKWGQDSNIECSLLTPDQSHELDFGRFWHVMWEAGPYEWGVNLSLDGVTFVEFDGEFDRDRPEIIMGAPEDWYLQPYYSFDVGFIPNTVFADFPAGDESSNIIVVSGFVADKLMREIAAHPSLLRTIERRTFEKLIAELFDGFGYQVELTQRTRDGGKDIIAVKKIDTVDIRYLIECKRPDPGNKIAVSTIRELLGVKADDPASKAILVTTTDFTRDAKLLMERHRWNLEGKVYDDIVAWVNNYNRIKGITP